MARLSRSPIWYYQDAAGRWRWKVVSGGKVVAASSQGFTRKWSAKRNAILTRLKLGLAAWVDQTG